MTTRFTVPAFLALGAVLACLALPAAVNAQGKPKPHPPDKNAPARKRALEALQRAALERAAALNALTGRAAEYEKKLHAAQKAAAVGKTFQESLLLQNAFLLLADARHDYEGHRPKAMHHTEAALKILDDSLMKKGTPLEKAITKLEEKERATASASAKATALTPRDYENLITSGPLLQSAREWLLLAQQSLAQKNKQATALEHVDAAIKQIDAALKEAEEWHKLMQAEALRQAFILLAWANHDYDGYRHKAMNQVQAAVHLLDADIMKNGDALEKAKEAVQKKVVNAVKMDLDALPDIHEIQLASDLLLKTSREWLHLVHHSLEKDKPGAAEHVHKAIVQIDAALKLAAPQWARFRESAALREAYLLLAAANSDPGGRRAKAMGQIWDAVKILDRSLENEGGAMHRAMKALEKQTAAGAKVDEQLLFVSDFQFQNAREWVVLVQRNLRRNDQTGEPLKHVDQALKELNVVLKIE